MTVFLIFTKTIQVNLLNDFMLPFFNNRKKTFPILEIIRI